MSDNPFLSGNFGPIETESTVTGLKVQGEIPRDLAGRLLRIGPNPVAPGENDHWFAGNGLVHGLRLRDGEAEWYRSRFVRDDSVCDFKGWPHTAGPRFREDSSGLANTNVIGVGGKTYAIVEGGGFPVEIDYELETVRSSNFGGGLSGPFSAHPKRDPDTGELHAAGYFSGWDHLQHVVVSAGGKVLRTLDIPVPGRPMVHDCAITENYFIVFDFPVVFRPVEGGAEEGTLGQYIWHEEYGSRVGLLPRTGSADEIVWCEVENCFVFHPLNAYEDADGRVVLDVVRHPKMFASNSNGPGEGPPTLDRWLLDPKGGAVKEDRISDRPQEFPRHDERLVGKPYRYGYCGASGESGLFGGLLKHDLRTGETLHRDDGPSKQYQEPVFVPCSEEADEDDGWVMSYRHDAERNKAEVVILHAQDFLGTPLATIDLTVRVPFGFHGNWVPDS
ncbi:MAG TPA: carotenoid oxygenase [Myxococcales bacterium]|nr:carotenoid oxygenase [Myxococcales bacterium]